MLIAYISHAKTTRVAQQGHTHSLGYLLFFGSVSTLPEGSLWKCVACAGSLDAYDTARFLTLSSLAFPPAPVPALAFQRS